VANPAPALHPAAAQRGVCEYIGAAKRGRHALTGWPIYSFTHLFIHPLRQRLIHQALFMDALIG
jgi:hypothetical protein